MIGGRLELHFAWYNNEENTLPTWLKREINPRLRQYIVDNLGEPIDIRMWNTWSPLWEAIRLGTQ
jgi:hypothetical protein